MSLTPKIIYGTAWKMEQTASLVVAAVLQGFRAIDTACQPKHYREDQVGQALQELQEKHNIKREDLFIQTKFTPISGQDTTKPLPYSPTSPISTQVTTSFTRTLSNLQTTYVDSYLLHSPLRTLEQTLEAWGVLAKLQDEGKARLIGVSNTYDVRMLARLHKERKVQVVQNRWYEGNGWDKAVVGFCREHGIMYQSFWTLTGSPSLLSLPALLAIAQSANITPAEAVYRISQLEGIVPLSGTKDETHMREDVEVQNVQFDEDGLDWAFDEVREFIR